MDSLDTILKSCIPTDESSKRQPSILSDTSKQSNSQTLLIIIEKTFENIAQKVHGIPITIEERLDDLMQKVTEIPMTIEQSFDDLIHIINEKLSFQNFRAETPGVKITRCDFQPGEGKSLIVISDLDFEKLMNSDNSNRRSIPSSRSSSSLDEEIGEGVESDTYLMGLTSPGVETPPQSSRMSKGYTEFYLNQIIF